MHFSMISVPYTEYLKFRKNGILYTRILTKKYHIPELKWPEIPYTQNPWPGLISEETNKLNLIDGSNRAWKSVNNRFDLYRVFKHCKSNRKQ